MNDGNEKVYRDVPIPDRRREDRSSSRMEGRTGCTQPPQRTDSGRPAASSGTGPGESPWNYITEEDLLRNFGGNFTDSYRERRLKEQEQYQAFREKVKSGEDPDQPYVDRVRYARRWVSELLGPGREESPEEGYRILERFGQELADGFTLSGYPADILKEIRKYYVIATDLPRSYVAEAFADEIAEDEKILALIMYPEADPDQLYRSVSELGRYRGEKSHFFQEHAEDMKAALARVYSAWADAYEEKYKKPLSDELLGESDTRAWYPWQALHMSPPPASRKQKMVFLVDPVLVYWCKSGSWTITQYFPNIYGNRHLREQLGQICRETERLMREKAGCRKLKPVDMDEGLKKLTARAVAAYLKDKAEAARPRLKLDLGKLGSIRSDADYTRDQLLTEEETEAPAELLDAAVPSALAEPLEAAAPPAPAELLDAAVPSATAEDGSAKDAFGLTTDEKEILRLLLMGQDPASYLRSRHLLPSLIADSINEKFYDEIGDSVLEETDQGISLVEDYADDLRDLTGY